MAVHEAIEAVNHIIETLRATLDDMEEVLETLELAERQKNADEQEIETLRRSLRQLHRPRESGQHPPRH
jgi:predicted RNase H-like nuclease (RuvC/YqgF family)